MKVLVVTSGINPASGGPTRSCKGMCRALSQAGVDVTLLVLGGHHPFENPSGVKVCYAADQVKVKGQGQGQEWRVADFDLAHLQGLWNLKLHKIAKSCRKAGVPYVISPRGMLDPWALSVKKWKKRLGMLLYQRSDLKHAAAFHATAELEASNIRAQGLKQPIFIAPNGVEVPEGLGIRGLGVQEFRSSGVQNFNSGERVAIFLSRLHPGKGLLTLAEAWARVKPQGWVMRVVGPDSYGHKPEVIAKLDSLSIPHFDVPARTAEESRSAKSKSGIDNVHCQPQPSTSTSSHWEFVDMVDDVRKWHEYSAAEILIHPSVSENFGITIAEGLYAGLPVICTKGTPWKDVEECHCGKWIDQGVDALAAALSELLNLSTSELRALGANGRALIERKYLWPAIARQVISGYEGVLK